MTYQRNGQQYVALMAGWGGAAALFGGDAAVATGTRNVSRMLVFKLDGKAQLSTPAPLQAADRVPQPVVAAASTLNRAS
ncbi:hypothetical protein ULF88_19730 [Halopseudomonas pachastrellae]|nr:hypothetical protein [Halopseudomonas pachastrellae]